jgi:hypothetical protein
MTSLRFALVSPIVPGLILSLAACAGSKGGPDGSTSSAAGTGGATATASSSSSSSGGAGTGGAEGTGGTGGAGPSSTVTFRYKPEWAGVTAVEVIGGFGQTTDWNPATPLVKLAADASGTWTGTATLPAGQYPYLYRVAGDASGPATYQRYAIDSGVSAFVACPTGSPTFDTKNANPCSQLTVPQGAADAEVHVTGKVLYGGQPIGGYLVLIERQEMKSHHFFANRVDSAADGTFDLAVAAGTYDLQVLHPTFLDMTDVQRDPLTLKAMRRALAPAFPVASAVAVGPVEMQYPDYAALAPTGTVAAAPPTTFAISVIAGATAASVEVYGTPKGAGQTVGDPWYASTPGTATSVMFNGTFTTAQATEPMVVAGEAYFWGTEQRLTKSVGTMVWTGQSMVLPIKWP